MKTLHAALILVPVLLASGPAAAQDPATKWNERGVAALEAGQLDEAVNAFRRGHRLEPGDAVLRLNLARAFGHRARFLMESGRMAEALADLDQGTRVERDQGTLEVLEAQVYLSTDRRSEAQQVLVKVRADFPDNLEAIRLLASIYAVSGQVDNSVAILEEALGRHPEDEATAERLNQLKEEQRAWNGFLTDSSAHFDFRYDPQRPEIVQAVPYLMRDLEDAYQAVYRNLGLAPRDRILVLVLDRERYKGQAPQWSGGLYDGRIRMAVGDYKRERERIRATLRHEYTHAALHRLGARLPTWMHEGLAQWVEERPVDDARARLARNSDKLPDLLSLQGNWTEWTDQEKVIRAYDYGLSLCDWIRDEFGPVSFNLLFENVRTAGFEEGFRRTFARSVEEVDAAHRAALTASF